MLNETQIGEVWLLFADYIDKKQLDVVAERYVELLLDNGVTDRTLQHAMGVEHNLDQAIEYYFEDEENEREEIIGIDLSLTKKVLDMELMIGLSYSNARYLVFEL